MRRRARRLPARLALGGGARAGARAGAGRRPARSRRSRCPVFLYGELAATPERRERAYFRRGGLAALAERMRSRRARPRPRPRGAAPERRARRWSPPARRWPRSTSSSTRARSRSRGRSPRGCASPAAGLPACARSGSTSRASPRSRPTSTTRSRSRSATVIERVRDLAAEHGARPVAGEVVGLVPEAALARPPRRRAAARLRARSPPARAAARRARNRRRLGTLPADGADEKTTPPQAPRDADRADRQPRPARAPAHPRGGEGTRAPEAVGQAQAGRPARRRPDLEQRLQARPDRRRGLLPALLARLQPPGGRGRGALDRDAGDVRAARLLHRPVHVPAPAAPACRPRAQAASASRTTRGRWTSAASPSARWPRTATSSAATAPTAG